MTFSEPGADYLIDRRSLRRKVSFWRVGAFLALGVAVLAIGWRVAGPTSNTGFQHHVARISIDGIITGDRETLKVFDDVAKSNSATALIVSIESPGGTTTGAERLYASIRRVAEKKPVIAVVRGMAASGGYIAALGADRIVAQGNSLVGSIGVLFQFPNVSKLLDTVGVKMEEVKSSPLKAAPNGYETTSPEARAALGALVSDSFDWFKQLVKERRHLQDAELSSVADGRVYTGRQGLGLKLVDGLGEERDAVAWLESERHITRDLPIRDWKKERNLDRFGFFGLSASVAETLGFSSVAEALHRFEEANRLRVLDGLISVWQSGVVN